MTRVFRAKIIELVVLWVMTVFPASVMAEPLRLGAIFSLSGFGADGGNSELNGLMMARDRINAEGGIAGRPVELVVEDNHSDLVATATAFKHLASVENVPLIFGPNWTEFFDIAAALSKIEKLPIVAFSGYKASIFADNPWVFSLWPPHAISTKPLADCVAQSGPIAATVFLNDNGYFQAIWEAMEPQLLQAGLKVSRLQRFSPGTTDFRSALSLAKKDSASTILALLKEGGDLSSFCRQVRQLRLAAKIFAANVPPYDDLIKNNPGVCEGLVFFDFATPGGSAFLESYRQRFKREAGTTSAKAYDGLFLVKQAVERCGASRTEIGRCLHETQYQGISGPISFDNNGVIKNQEATSHLVQIRNGQFEQTNCPSL